MILTYFYYSLLFHQLNAVFGFDDQERNLTFVETNFLVLKLKFYTYNFRRFSILFINYISRDLDNTKILL